MSSNDTSISIHKVCPIGFLLPGLPHLVLASDQNEGWRRLRASFARVRAELEARQIDLKWTHVDDEFHHLGSIPYELKSDIVLAKNIDQAARKRNLTTRLTNYHGFPVDTGTVVIQTLLNSDQRFKTVVMSSNIYADRAETVVLGKAVREGILESKRKVAAIVISSLSNRLHSEWIEPQKDHIRSLKDQEWNQKFLEFLSEGRLEDISQLSRQFHREARIHKVSNYKPFWWLSAVMGQNNLYRGELFEYQPVFGTGAAVVSLTPSDQAARDLEFDENDPEIYLGERNVLETSIEIRTQMDSHFHFERGEHVDN